MLSNTQKAYMNVARYMAAKSVLRHKHGAVVVKSGRILGSGFNKSRNHPDVIMEGRHRLDCGYHAEAVALKEAGEKARGAVLFVARINRRGQDMLSRPCTNCQKLIEEHGVKKIVYTHTDR